MKQTLATLLVGLIVFTAVLVVHTDSTPFRDAVESGVVTSVILGVLLKVGLRDGG